MDFIKELEREVYLIQSLTQQQTKEAEEERRVEDYLDESRGLWD